MTSSPLEVERPAILLVDDEGEILVALEDLLEDRYRIRATTSPGEALEWLRAGDVAVIVSDQRMPEMPGDVFLARAREVSRAEAILLTGYADLSAVASAVNAGAISGYAQKPWEPEALVAMVAAAAERHRLAEALRFERAIYAALVERSPAAVSVLDGRHRPVRVNAAKAAQSRGFDLETREAERAADADALAVDAQAEEEHRWTDEAGASRWRRIRRVSFGPEGQDRFLLKIETDETQRRLAEQKLHQSEKLQALGTLAGGIAHDFNNLLAVVLGNLELAARTGGDPEKLARYLSSATDAAKRGGAISRRLLTFSRQEDLAVERFAPDEAIRDLADLLAQAMAGQATVRLDIDRPVWPVRANPSQFELALMNLCINARDAMPDGGEVAVTARDAAGAELPEAVEPGDYVRISVTDEGSGMAEEVRARVFEPFFTTKPHGRGTGLGLPMVRAMAEAAGGTATIESRPGEGTRVDLWLPRDAGEDAAIGPERKRDAAGPLRLLVAEDEPGVAGMLDEQLRQMGHQVTLVPSGDAALGLLEAGPAFDLLLTDYAMPKLSGVTLAGRVAERWPGLPVLLMTGFADFEPDESLRVLPKPFTTAQLEAAIADAVGATGAG